MKLKIHRFLPETRVEGPGKRACIWVQGCSRHCEGCAAKNTWDERGGKYIEVDYLVKKILNISGIEGVTFAGGEPFEQAKALSELGAILKQNNLSIVTFTGYLLEELQSSNNRSVKELLNLTDILIDGPFIKEKKDFSRPWVGSSNQRHHFLTKKYKYLENNLLSIKNKLEIRICSNGKVLVNGMGDFDIFKKIK